MQTLPSEEVLDLPTAKTLQHGIHKVHVNSLGWYSQTLINWPPIKWTVIKVLTILKDPGSVSGSRKSPNRRETNSGKETFPLFLPLLSTQPLYEWRPSISLRVSWPMNRLSTRGWGKERGWKENRGDAPIPTPFPPRPLHSQPFPSWPFQPWSDPSSWSLFTGSGWLSNRGSKGTITFLEINTAVSV